MKKWCEDHPAATHLIVTLIVTVIVAVIGVCFCQIVYGDWTCAFKDCVVVKH